MQYFHFLQKPESLNLDGDIVKIKINRLKKLKSNNTKKLRLYFLHYIGHMKCFESLKKFDHLPQNVCVKNHKSHINLILAKF
jgi:hypothetical protein